MAEERKTQPTRRATSDVKTQPRHTPDRLATDEPKTQPIRSRFKDVEGFDREKDLGVWVRIDDENKHRIEKAVPSLISTDFHMINSALILDLPSHKVGQGWEARNSQLFILLEMAASMVDEGGNVKISYAKFSGDADIPSLGLFFGIKNDGQTDDELMTSFNFMFSRLPKPHEWGNKNEIPNFPEGDSQRKLPHITKVA